jgi:hypothetical protein
VGYRTVGIMQISSKKVLGSTIQGQAGIELNHNHFRFGLACLCRILTRSDAGWDYQIKGAGLENCRFGSGWWGCWVNQALGRSDEITHSHIIAIR